MAGGPGNEGMRLDVHRDAAPSYIPSVNPGHHGGGTYTSQSMEPTLEAYENIFGPSARDIKQDLQRFKRHGRWHLPDILKGPNQYLTDRIDGLITDATQSPFTSRILPYKYITNVDGKIKWNVWSFDEGLSSRVPYESAARTLTQSKRSYAGYTIRQGMAIVLEHNFMMTEAGRQNFKNQLQQLVGSIQLTNDLDVHIALVLAPSHEKHMRERYMVPDKSPAQTCREFVDLFGFVQKNQNALDILIEEAKATLRSWGSPMPDFMLCNSKLTFQLTMTPDATNYVTKGAEGVKRLRTGPDLPSYRGIGIVHTRAFSMEAGQLPRDILRRRVRVAEYYRILPHRDNHRRLFQLYNEERDTWSTFTFPELLKKAVCGEKSNFQPDANLPGDDNPDRIQTAAAMQGHAGPDAAGLPRPGVALGTNIDNNLRGSTRDQLLDVVVQVLEDRANAKFRKNAIAIDKGVVYAAGADPLLMPTENYRDGHRDRIPELMHAALDKFEADTPALGPLRDARLHEAIYKVNSICSYPRTIGEFLDLANVAQGGGDTNYLVKNLPNDYMDIKKAGGYAATEAILKYKCARFMKTRLDAADTIETARVNLAAAIADHQAAAAAAAGGAAAGPPPADPFAGYDGVDLTVPNARLLREKILYRNFRRYAIPKAMLRGDVPDGNPSFDRVLQLAVERDTANPFDGYLRHLGAFYHPNYFQGDEEFYNWGDYIGYYATLLSETVQTLCRKKAGRMVDEMYPATWLYWVLTTKPQNVMTDIQAMLVDLKTYIETPANHATRMSVGIELHNRLERIYRAHDGGCTQADTKTPYYWLWPNCDSAENDVYLKPDRNPHRWVKEIHEYIPQFHVTYELDAAVAAEIVRRSDVFPPCALTHDLRGNPGLKPITISHAYNFVYMLAWRLWSDRSVGLREVYRPATEAWGNFSHYCRDTLDYGYDHIGGAVRLFKIDEKPHGSGGGGNRFADVTEDIEVVIVRPNIEHYMLGIILGQGGESLGSTFWGQTELSCYDDSMHGIWGMSYKYNERAIVINERNLVRLWDIAYDGYVGGKDDTAVEWDNRDEQVKNSAGSLVKGTMDVTMPYRGPSMMVMAFDHGRSKRAHSQIYRDKFNSNWPSPIVFYDRQGLGDQESLASDFDNIHVVGVKEFRVFNNDLYKQAYTHYHDKMPDFYELHRIRKNAGVAAVENEVSSDALAFQGTMRVLHLDTGSVIQEILGSGHHGPDFVGVASLRAGKGYKINSQPTIQRLV